MKNKISFTILILFVFLAETTIAGYSKFKREEDSCQKEVSITYKDLYQEIVNQGISYPEIVWAQAVLESGHFSSKVFKNNQNIFGMKHPKKRKTLSLGSMDSYAVYLSWRDCVKDYKIYQDEIIFRNKKLSRSSYFNYLDKKYCEAGSSYSKKVKKIAGTLSKRIKNKKQGDDEKIS